MIKKHLKKLMVALLCGVMILSNVEPVVSYAEDSEQTTLPDSDTIKEALKIVFDEPVSQGNPTGSSGLANSNDDDNRWQQLSLPIGNSYMGANIYGEIGTERVTFNQKTLWNGGPSENRENYNGGNIETVNYNGQTYDMSEFVKMVQNEFLYGNANTASAMCNYIVGSSDGYGAYQSFGEIQLDFGLSGTPTNYTRDLDLTDAVANVDFTLNGATYHREYFASYPDNVIAMKMTATETMNAVTVSFPIDQPALSGDAALGKICTTTAEGKKITVAGELKDNQMKFNGQLEVVLPGEGTVTANNNGTLTVSGAKEFVVFVSADTDYKNEYPNYRTGETDEQLDDSVADVVSAAVDKGYDEVKQDAVADYTKIFDRVELNLGQCVTDKTTDELLAAYNAGSATEAERRTLETLLFQYGRFLQIQSSRAGDLPANLQGVWNTRSGNYSYVPWGSDYHMNVNLQMNYWPTYVTNMAECAIPLIDYVESLVEPGRVTAETYFGIVSEDGEANGFSAHTQNTPFGWTCPGWAFSWGWSPAAVPWILQNVYEYYEYTGDKTMLEDQIYPLLKEEAILYSQILVEDPDTGRLVTAPAYSPEHGPYTAGNTYEQSLVWQLFKDASEAADALGVDADLSAEWKELQEKTMPIEIGDDGQIKEWYEETTLGSMGQSGHRHLSHLLGLYPGDLISFDNDEYLDAAIISLTDRGDNATGWGMGQRLNSWARVGDGNHAYDIIKAFFKSGAYPNLWDSHAPFQIDGNFGYTSGVAEMLIQSNMGYINMLPALADTWADGEVSGLVARGNFEVSMAWNDLNLTDATILSKNGGECVVEYPTITTATVLDQDGNEVEVTKVSDSRISFETEAGKTYTIEDVAARPAKAPANAEAIYVENEAIITFDEVATATAYNVYESTDGETYTKVAEVTANEYKVTDYADGKTYKVAAVVNDAESELTDVITPELLEITNKIDDRDARIKYDGFNNWGPQDGQYMETEKYSTTVGATAEFYFYGNTVRVIAMKNTDCHTFDLYIDGELVRENVDTNAGSCLRQQTVAEVSDLTDGIHKVELVVKQGKVSLDAFEFDANIPVSGLEIVGDDSLNMSASATLQLTANYLPAGAAGAGVNWSVESVEKENVATINENGLLTAADSGVVVVTATDKENSSLIATKTIRITKEATAIKYDDSDAGITYTTGQGSWVSWGDGRYYMSTGHEITGADVNADASFSFSFDGTGLALYGMKLVHYSGDHSAGALLNVYIDDELVETVSTFKNSGTEADPQQKWFEKLDLSSGTHTVKVELAGLSQEALDQGAVKPKVAFDYYEVTVDGEECTEHEITAIGAKEATCTEAGYTGDKVCTECGELVEAGTTIAALDHKETELQNAKEATCTESGYTGDTVCKACGEKVEAGTTIPAAGHGTTELQNAKEVTCTEDGYTGDAVCKACGVKVDAGATIPAVGHDFGDWTVVKEATQDSEGLKERVCDVCGTKEEQTIEKLPVNPVDPDEDGEQKPDDTDKDNVQKPDDTDKDNEQKPDDKEDGKTPATGDSATIFPFAALMLACVAMVAVIIRKRFTLD